MAQGIQGIIKRLQNTGVLSSELQESIVFLRELLKSESKPPDSCRVKKVFGLAECAQSALKQIGYDKLQKIEEFLRTQGITQLVFPGVVNFGPAFSQERLQVEATVVGGYSLDTIDCAFRTLATYETIASWAERVREYETVAGLRRILDWEETA